MASAHLKGSLDLLVLGVLRDGPTHGYGVITALRYRSAGEFDLAEGTVYPALHKLETAGFIRSRWDASSGRRRRVYALTERGEREFATQRADWLAFLRGMHAVVGAG
jgi:DNA-binding PadR family transcriptional regulator